MKALDLVQPLPTETETEKRGLCRYPSMRVSNRSGIDEVLKRTNQEYTS